MMKPPISRMGGKSKLRKQIIELIPEHTCYCEPFFGAGWVYFGKNPSKVEAINDIDGELVNLFKMIKYHAEEVQRLLKYEVCSREVFVQYKNIDISQMTDVQRAVRFIYLLSQSFASKGNHFGIKVKGKPSQKIFTTEHLAEVKKRLSNTFIENLSFEKVFEKYDRQHTFFFCDPPYFKTAGYSNQFEEKDYIKLRDELSNIKGKFLLTINDHPQVREWYKDFNMIETKVGYSVSKSKKGRKKYGELMIKNY
ncbi:DNA adenine methylase [Dethiothermospora halolimnae]|uniref:DNA adenine methylase n=1 Tax=Dethiothermospora halolimnae TaxID=3114390 RepID=UPI003CCBF700